MRIGSVIALALLCAGSCCAAGGSVFYVSPNGNDSWSGATAKPDKAGTDGPFATLERAREAARAAQAKPVTVIVRGGTYYLDQPLAIGPEDSGVAYVAEGKVVISGGRVITGFAPVEVNGHTMIAADVPEAKDGSCNFTQLFVNGRRANRTRLPKQGYYWFQDLAGVPMNVEWNIGQDKVTYKPGDLKPWKNLSDVDILAFLLWVESRMPIRSIDESTHTVQFGKKSVFRMTDDHSGRGARYVVENVFEALDTPGQWYLDRAEGRLYYYPLIGEDVRRAVFVAPKLPQLVRVVGTPDQPVKDVSFRSIHFAHTQWFLPSDSAGASQAAVCVPGAVYFENAKDCSVKSCDISHIGTYAVEVANGCSGIAVEKNRISDMGAGGVKIGPGSESTTVANNDIGDGGKIFMSAIGVWIGNSPKNVISHNNIHDLYYTGVSLGWVWGYGESKAHDNIIEYNHIHNIGQRLLSDLGGIYSLGIQPGTIEHNNLIHDCYSASYGGWGIYTDEGSSGILIENNVVYNTKTGSFHQHYGKENTVRNNIFALSQEWQLQRTRQEPHKSFTFERNIVYYNEGTLLGSNWGDFQYVMDSNIYWDTSGRPVTFAGMSFEDWQAKGQDAHSLIADPMFVNPEKHDYRLKPGSPALKLGFRQIDVSTVGPRGRVGPGR